MANRPRSVTGPSPAAVVTRHGGIHVLASREEARAFLSQPLTAEELAQRRRAAQLVRELRARILERTGGQGIAEEDMQDALHAMRDH